MNYINVQKLASYILFVVCMFLAGCNDDVRSDFTAGSEAVVKLMFRDFGTRVIDQDNLESEQKQIHITILLTEPASDQVVYKFIDAGFTTVDDYKLVYLPVDSSTLGRKDIYVITNYGNTSFDDVMTLQDLSLKTTPAVSAVNNLNPEEGLCMYGETFDFDFANNTNTPAIVYMERTCVKFRVTVSFPENPTLSTDNSFLIKDAANYSYIVENNIDSIPSTAYYDYVTPITLQANEANAYVNTTYVYEATRMPQITIYTHINNSAAPQEFTEKLPIPMRNYLYDLDVKIYEHSSNSRSEMNRIFYRHEMSVTVFDEQGRMIQ